MLPDLRTAWRSLARSPLFTLTAAGFAGAGHRRVHGHLQRGLRAAAAAAALPAPGRARPHRHGQPRVPGKAPFRAAARRTVLNALAPRPGLGFVRARRVRLRLRQPHRRARPRRNSPSGWSRAIISACSASRPRLGRIFTEADCRAAGAADRRPERPRSGARSSTPTTGHHRPDDHPGRPAAHGRSASCRRISRTSTAAATSGSRSPRTARKCNPASAPLHHGRRASPTRARLDARSSTPSCAGTLSANLAQADPVHYKNWHLEAHPLGGGLLIDADARTRSVAAASARWAACCWSPAPTSPTCSSSARRPAGARWACAWPSARAARGSCGFASRKASCSPASARPWACWPRRGAWTPSPRCCRRVIRRCRTASALEPGPRSGLPPSPRASPASSTGLLPALGRLAAGPGGLAGGPPAGAASSEGPAGRRVRAALVVAEIALALVLLAGAGLMGRSLLAALRSDAGLRLGPDADAQPFPFRHPLRRHRPRARTTTAACSTRSTPCPAWRAWR